MFFKHFASKNQLPGLSVRGILVENGLKEPLGKGIVGTLQRDFCRPSNKVIKLQIKYKKIKQKAELKTRLLMCNKLNDV